MTFTTGGWCLSLHDGKRVQFNSSVPQVTYGGHPTPGTLRTQTQCDLSWLSILRLISSTSFPTQILLSHHGLKISILQSVHKRVPGLYLTY